MRPSQFPIPRYLPRDSAYPFLGLNLLDPPSMANPSYSPTFTNLYSDKGVVSKRAGYSAMGTAITGTPMALIDFVDASGVEHLVLITTSKMYVYDTVNDQWDDISPAVNWTGDETNVVDWTIATGTQGTWLVVTNGKDHPMYWDGVGANFLDITAHANWAYTGFVTCRSVKAFYNHLVLINVDTATEGPFIVAWSDAGSLVDFENGTSGTVLVGDSEGGPLLKGVRLKDRLLLYSQNSIATMTWVGGDQIFVFEQIAQDTRLMSERSIVDVGGLHIFLSKDNIKGFDGVNQPMDVGDMVSKEYRDIVNYDKKYRSFAFFDAPKGRVYIGVPNVDDTTTIYVVDMVSGQPAKWSKFSYAAQVRCMGYFGRVATLTWADLNSAAIAWSSIAFTWAQSSIQKGFPVRVMALDSSVVLADDTKTTDSGTAISATFESIDFVVPAEYKSVYAYWYEIEIEARGDAVEVSYSTDGGQTFTVIDDSLDLTGAFERYKIDASAHARTFRVRLRHTSVNGTFELRWLRVWYKVTSCE